MLLYNEVRRVDIIGFLLRHLDLKEVRNACSQYSHKLLLPARRLPGDSHTSRAQDAPNRHRTHCVHAPPACCHVQAAAGDGTQLNTSMSWLGRVWQMESITVSEKTHCRASQIFSHSTLPPWWVSIGDRVPIYYHVFDRSPFSKSSESALIWYDRILIQVHMSDNLQELEPEDFNTEYQPN